MTTPDDPSATPADPAVVDATAFPVQIPHRDEAGG